MYNFVRPFYVGVPVTENPSAGIDLVLLLDENMPHLDPCHPGCEDDRRCLCVHRFDPRVRVFHAEDVGISKGSSDLQVIESFINLVRNDSHGVTKGTTVEGTRWAILTKDGPFCKSAQHRHLSRVGRATKDLHFSVSSCCVWTRVFGEVLIISAVRLELRTGAKRNEILGESVSTARRLLRDITPIQLAP